MALTDAWKKTVLTGITDARWDEYDGLIQAEVANYKLRYKQSVDWLVIKAMLWIESGGPDNASWKTRPLQIGNPGDPAYAVLKAGKEGSDEIMKNRFPSRLRTDRSTCHP